MPELPEVETIVRGLEITGQRILRVRVLWPGSVRPSPDQFVHRLEGQRVVGVGRRGKWLKVSLSEGDSLLIHLRMSGRLLFGRDTHPHTRVVLELEDGRHLCFEDPRKFGRMVLTRHPEHLLDSLGPEPLSEGFTADLLGEMLAVRRGRLKPLLLNQRFLAGLGNIYTDQALWEAGIHPLRRANTLSAEEVARLHRAIQDVLRRAIERSGTTLNDGGYVRADGQPGRFASLLTVYGRAGEPCPRCSTPIVRIRVGGRGTHLCPRCQVNLAHGEEFQGPGG